MVVTLTLSFGNQVVNIESLKIEIETIIKAEVKVEPIDSNGVTIVSFVGQNASQNILLAKKLAVAHKDPSAQILQLVQDVEINVFIRDETSGCSGRSVGHEGVALLIAILSCLVVLHSKVS